MINLLGLEYVSRKKIEFAQHKLLIIVRDIPVFREVAGDHAYYFDGKGSEDLVVTIKKWLALYDKRESILLQKNALAHLGRVRCPAFEPLDRGLPTQCDNGHRNGFQKGV
ncbi:hypothetical protein V6X63_09840 [Spiribacter sp. 221]|uniref:hypothetical protein n=1 Tax=Spiribacter onubensis TaxID=3122420 RepID=UPI00349F84B6